MLELGRVYIGMLAWRSAGRDQMVGGEGFILTVPSLCDLWIIHGKYKIPRWLLILHSIDRASIGVW